ncbi:extracellular matrix regulator RemB [Candidatus Contubernalis alkaliaceticus]|uniref:extracellular matrix regulator RemB n=1 Tax=Candidatus Contubernalis alkaliaceticus TaxID=338645 RepID=UPI001F4BFAD0|nr:extracellular matrix/biofilm biosynthesis regulator RemA family protein [Candidatus Contubernalis alkalaceticus]UNC90616.1 DUF370 domain-containing protein [Candidatus Contubernalis alkalaceticus]
MYLHIGNSYVVPLADILGIFNLNLISCSSTKEFLQSKEIKNVVVTSDKEEAKSFIVTADKIYYSSIAPTTLKKRVALISK